MNALRQLTGDVLYVDLTERRVWREPMDGYVPSYIGGRGVGARLLWDLVRADVDPFGADNVLIFSPGLLTGAGVTSSGRTTVTCIAPTNGFYLKTNGGGHFGGMLKYAGYGSLVVLGRAESPVYLWIDDERVEIRDAKELWGLDVRATDSAVKAAVGDEDAVVACIGPAGEKRVIFASVMFSVYNAAGRGGAGAVMGAKNLKAIAVKGTGYIRPLQPERFHAARGAANHGVTHDSGYQGLSTYGTSGSLAGVNEVRALASYNFRRSHLEDVYPITGQYLTASGLLKRRVACYSCLIGCHRFCTVDEGPWAGTYSGGPEYESLVALGSGTGTLDTAAILKVNEIADLMGMDTISLGGVIQWAIETREKGLLSRDDTDGLDLRWGNAEAIVEMARKIGVREGFGDLLAQGTKRASEIVGGDSYKWAVQAKGLEQSRVDTRSAKAYALAFAVNPRGADHLFTETFAEFGMGPEARGLVACITGDERYTEPYCSEKRAEIVRWHEDCYAVTDALGLCAFTTTALYGITPALMAELYSAATGIETSEEEIMLLGRRIMTLEKCINVRHGAARADDVLPWRLMHEVNPDRPEPDAVNSPEELGRMLDEYYDLHGWDRATSWPTRDTLALLGLDDVADSLEAAGRLGGVPQEG